MLQLLLLLLGILKPAFSADLHKALFHPKTSEEHLCRYVAAGFVGAWIAIVMTALIYWLIRRRPMPAFTYELEDQTNKDGRKAVSVPTTTEKTEKTAEKSRGDEKKTEAEPSPAPPSKANSVPTRSTAGP